MHRARSSRIECVQHLQRDTRRPRDPLPPPLTRTLSSPRYQDSVKLPGYLRSVAFNNTAEQLIIPDRTFPTHQGHTHTHTLTHTDIQTRTHAHGSGPLPCKQQPFRLPDSWKLNIQVNLYIFPLIQRVHQQPHHSVHPVLLPLATSRLHLYLHHLTTRVRSCCLSFISCVCPLLLMKHRSQHLTHPLFLPHGWILQFMAS